MLSPARRQNRDESRWFAFCLMTEGALLLELWNSALLVWHNKQHGTFICFWQIRQVPQPNMVCKTLCWILLLCKICAQVSCNRGGGRWGEAITPVSINDWKVRIHTRCSFFNCIHIFLFNLAAVADTPICSPKYGSRCFHYAKIRTFALSSQNTDMSVYWGGSAVRAGSQNCRELLLNELTPFRCCT